MGKRRTEKQAARAGKRAGNGRDRDTEKMRGGKCPRAGASSANCGDAPEAERQPETAFTEINGRRLPAEYLAGMEVLLGGGFPRFLKSYEEPPKKGLRFNTRKARTETIEALKKSWKLRPVPWCADGYYYEEEIVRPGKSPYHDAGVFYIQEPSAMITAEKADIRPWECVLDLCAAPGGKSTQAAAKAGILVSNEPIAKRAKILSSNIERMGFENVIVTSAMPDALADVLGEAFDKVIVDAPCSGEGMMRRDAVAAAEWSLANVALCETRQAEILEAAARLLACGGRLIYSTCTFEPCENRWQINRFLHRHPEFSLIEMESLFPHEVEGEGHFCAVLEKGADAAVRAEAGDENHKNYGQTAEQDTIEDRRRRTEAITEAELADDENARERLCEERLPALTAELKRGGIHVLRAGIERGETVTGKHKGESRYEPSHAEILAGVYADGGCVNLLDEALCEKYLRGESIVLSEEMVTNAFAEEQDGKTAGTEMKEKSAPNIGASGDEWKTHPRALVSGGEGFVTVAFDGYPLGLGKRVGNVVKNHYPKGLRRV